MNEDQILLFLFRDVGLHWERTLADNANRHVLSTRSNAALRAFVRDNRVVYHITNANDLGAVQHVGRNTFFMTETGSTRIGSLLKHLRNSIMHGRFEISMEDNQPEVLVSDKYRNRTTMIGRIDIATLQELVHIVQI